MTDLTPPSANEPAPAETPDSAAGHAAPDSAPSPPSVTAALAATAKSYSWRMLAFDALLVALIGIGVYFRFAWVNWNEDTNLHPDEYGLTNTVSVLRLPESFDEYFNTRLSPISPYDKYDEAGNRTAGGPDNRMRWGQWPIILLKLGAVLTDNTGYSEQRLLGRQMSALADTLALAVLFLIGARLYNRRVGLLAAALSALAVMQIQQSHFMTSDNFAVLFTALAMYCAVRVAQRGDWRWYALFGVCLGMTVASRINLAPLAGMVVVAAVIAHAHADEGRKTRDWTTMAQKVLMLCALAGVVSLLTFRVTHPMSFRAETGDTSIFTIEPNKDWLDSLAVAQSESSGIGGGPPGEQWTNRPALVFPWVNMVVWGMGLPFGLMAWAALAWAAWRLLSDEWRAHLLPVLWVCGYFLFMGTRWVKSVRYFLPIYPFLALLAAWALYEIWKKAQGARRGGQGNLAPRALYLKPLSISLFAIVLGGTLAWAWGFTSIYRNTNSRLQAVRWIYQNVPAPLNLRMTTADGAAYTEPLPFPNGAQLVEGAPHRIEFKAHASGVLTSVELGHARNAFDSNTPGLVTLALADNPDGNAPLLEAQIALQPAAALPPESRGASYSTATPPVQLEQDKTYYLFVSAAQGGPIELRGSVLTNENWDEGLPVPFDGRDPFGGLYSGLTMEVHWLDNADKLQMYLDNLAQADYIFVQSQRRLWASTRLPARYPLTMEYYRALFDGRLGFELAAQFQSPIVIGPLQVSDLTGTWAWGRQPDVPAPGPDFPFNYSPFAAEEAFSVYDHAPVWIFRKRADFSFERAVDVLSAVDLSKVVDQGPRDATTAPTLMMLTPERLAEQRAGGTWSAMFDANGWLNTSEPLAVIVWYVTIWALGALSFPLTFVAFRGFSDRGYALGRTVALLFVAWFAWILGSFRLLPYTQGTLALGVGVLALISGLMAWGKREEIKDFVRAHRRHILIVEGVSLALFALMLFVRWSNPDLWHPYYGGEKPMNFSYFNAVLKSTSFPPYDPWLAGGYINYYYYGYVIAGVPTKLLGIMPALAYNLLLPMLFSMIGINAFCVAYNLVEGTGGKAQEARRKAQEGKAQEARRKAQEENTNSQEPDPKETVEGREQSGVSDQRLAIGNSPSANTEPGKQSASKPQSLTPNPYLAGIAAALLIVVLGNLAQIRTYLVGFQKASDQAEVQSSALGDNDFSATLNGLGRVLTGKADIAVGLGSWYWDATRIVDYTNGDGGNEITEFPLFTFLYADLHAHMIGLPFTVLALAWAAALLLGGGQKRAWWERAAVIGLGALAIGVARPTNTWDYPVYLALGAVAILAAQWWHHPQLTRANLLSALTQTAALVGLATLLYYPYDQWFASAYTEAERWRGSTTTLEAYLYVHGLFLFVLITFLVVEARRWLAETPATVLTKAGEWLPVVTGALIIFAACLALLLYLEVSIALLALPLMLWAGLLILRGRAALALEKRAVLFLLGTGLAITLVVELVVLGGDIGRQNTIFKFYMQVWTLFSVAAGAALAWVWADRPRWSLNTNSLWLIALAALTGAAALYTVTAANAKMRDRFPAFAASPPGAGCEPIPGMPQPYTEGLPLDEQPHGLNGLAYLSWSSYCDQTYFLPLKYDYEAMRWLQDHVTGSPVIVEAQTFSLYKLSSRYAWNTGLPDVVGWDWHQRQQRGATPTNFISERGREVSAFYCSGPAFTPEMLERYRVCAESLMPDMSLERARAFLQQYDVRYIIVGPLERAYYPPEGLAKFDGLAAEGRLTVAYQNPGVTIYEVMPSAASQ
jgi:YYY domain-containing protein